MKVKSNKSPKMFKKVEESWKIWKQKFKQRPFNTVEKRCHVFIFGSLVVILLKQKDQP